MRTPTASAGPVYPFDGHTPTIAADVFIAPTAAVIGNVRIGAGSSVWFSAVVRGDDMPITIGCGTNIQDGAIIHGTEGTTGTYIGDEVVVGHGAVLHGCRIGSGTMVGIGAIILDGAIVETGAIVAAGAIVAPGKRVPAGTLWMAGSARRAINGGERAFLNYAPDHYRRRSGQYQAAGFNIDASDSFGQKHDD